MIDNLDPTHAICSLTHTPYQFTKHLCRIKWHLISYFSFDPAFRLCCVNAEYIIVLVSHQVRRAHILMMDLRQNRIQDRHAEKLN